MIYYTGKPRIGKQTHVLCVGRNVIKLFTAIATHVTSDLNIIFSMVHVIFCGFCMLQLGK